MKVILLAVVASFWECLQEGQILCMAARQNEQKFKSFWMSDQAASTMAEDVDKRLNSFLSNLENTVPHYILRLKLLQEVSDSVEAKKRGIGLFNMPLFLQTTPETETMMNFTKGLTGTSKLSYPRRVRQFIGIKG